MIQLVHLPIRGIRFLTDPIVDLFGLGLQFFFVGPLLRICGRFADAGFFRFILGENGVRDVTDALTSTVSISPFTTWTVL